MMVRRGWVSLEVGQVEDAVVAIEALVGQAGGHVASRSDAGGRNAHLAVRVPSASLDSVIESIVSLGTVTHRRVTAEDVTEQVVDTEARLRNLTALRDRLRALLDQAEGVQDVLAIEKELARVQADLDALQARLDALKDQADLAALSVSIHRRRILGPLGYAGRGLWWAVSKLFVIRD